MKFKGYPKAYKRNTQTKLLWLYKTSIITYLQYAQAKERIIEQWKVI